MKLSRLKIPEEQQLHQEWEIKGNLAKAQPNMVERVLFRGVVVRDVIGEEKPVNIFKENQIKEDMGE